MNLKHRIYMFWAYVRHLFTSWNTGGEGIHSPYLFYIVRMLVYDENRYYCWKDIEKERRKLLRSNEQIDVTDYGTGGKGQTIRRRVSDIAGSSLESKEVGQVLFRLVNFLSETRKEPLRIVELGTSLGITTAYLAMADSRNSVRTYEGSGELLKIAKGVWHSLGVKNIEAVEGNIDDTLYNTCARVSRVNNKGVKEDEKERPIGLAYIDANHSYEATMRYYERLQKQTEEWSIMVVDDIHYSPEMDRAWKEIGERDEVRSTMDFYHFGLVFFDRHYLKRHYKLRI